MGLADLRLTRDDFDATDWQAVVTETEKRECWAYLTRYSRRANAARERGDGGAEAVYSLLTFLCSLQFTPDDPADPFACRERVPGGAPPSIDELTPEQLAVLAEIMPTIEDDELRARIADVLWLRTRDYKAGEAAIAAYRASADRLEDPEKWTDCSARLIRGVRLAASLGRGRDAYLDGIAHVEKVLSKYNGEDPRYLSSTLMELLLEHGAGDAAHYAALGEKLATRAEEQNDYHRARTYWDLQIRWCRRGDDADGERRAKLAAAATFEKEAARVLERPGPQHLLAAMFLQQAVVALRRAGADKERVAEVHRRLLDHQEKSMEEMKGRGISHSMDVTDFADAAVKEVTGKPLDEALLTLVLNLASPPKLETLRQRVVESIRNFPLQNIFATSLMSPTGKTTARRRAPDFRDPAGDDEAVRVKMFDEAKHHHGLLAMGIIEPARDVILREHPARVADFVALANYSRFVPPGRELIYARGLYAGLVGDFLSAAHLLVPQVENSLRMLLQQRGVIASNINDDGVQEELDINTLLCSKEHYDALVAALGEDTVFDLRGLLIERSGSNLRNLLAHGLLSQGQFYSAEVCYFWWVTLRLCILGALRARSGPPQS